MNLVLYTYAVSATLKCLDANLYSDGEHGEKYHIARSCITLCKTDFSKEIPLRFQKLGNAFGSV